MRSSRAALFSARNCVPIDLVNCTGRYIEVCKLTLLPIRDLFLILSRRSVLRFSAPRKFGPRGVETEKETNTTGALENAVIARYLLGALTRADLFATAMSRSDPLIPIPRRKLHGITQLISRNVIHKDSCGEGWKVGGKNERKTRKEREGEREEERGSRGRCVKRRR